MSPQEFFYANAGFDWAPATETQEEGHQRCAKALAGAEKRARENGYWFDWGIEKTEPHVSHMCHMYDDMDRTVSSEGGIPPMEEDRRRICEAQLALHYFAMKENKPLENR